MKSRYATLFICIFLLTSRVSGQVVRYNDTFSIYHPVYKEGDRGYSMGRWGSPTAPGKILLKGRYKDSLPEGRWVFYHVNGSVAEVHNYKNGLLNGEFIKFNYDSSLAQKGQYVDNLKTGLWERYNYNGNGIFEEIRFYVNDTQQGGQFTRNEALGSMEEIYLIDGKATGSYFKYNRDGIMIRGKYYRDERFGVWVATNKYKLNSEYDSSVFSFKNNQLNDTSYYFNNGKLSKKTTYVNGKKNGPEYVCGDFMYGDGYQCKNCTKITGYLTEDFWSYERLHGVSAVINAANDTLMFSEYENGRKKGTYYLKYPDGRLSSKMIYGEEKGWEQWEWDTKGRLVEWELIKDDYEDIAGEFTIVWDSSGKLFYKDTVYFKNNLIGHDELEYNKGKLVSEKHWLDGKKEGRWFKKGEYEVYYKAGKLVRTVSGFMPEDDIPEVFVMDEPIEDVSEGGPWQGYSPFEAPDRIGEPLADGPDPFGIPVKSDVSANSYKGKVVIRIFINEDGYPSGARILTPVSPEVDAAALRLALTHHWPKERMGRYANKYRWKDVKVEF